MTNTGVTRCAAVGRVVHPRHVRGGARKGVGMQRRRYRRLSLIALGAALLASAALVGASTGGVRAARPTLVVGRTADVNTLDPHKSTAFQAVQTLDLIYG